MSQELIAFPYQNHQVHATTIDDGLWFVAKDVCDILDIGNVSQAVARIEDDEKAIISNDTPSGSQEMLIINESGLYSLILSSRKPEARPFRRWITKEVLPSIRKTGSYSLEQPKTKLEMIAEGFVHMARIEREHMQLRTEHNVLEERHDVLEEKHEELETKVKTIIQDREKAQAELAVLEVSDEAPAPKTVRAKINELVRAFAHAKDLPQAEIWVKLYRELNYRYSFNVNARKKGKPKSSLLDIVEEGGYLNELFKIASATCQIQKMIPKATLFP